MTRITRRDFLSTALFAPFALQRDARFIGTIPFGTPGTPTTPLDRRLGAGLDARLFTDLSTLGNPQSAIRDPQSDLVTPLDRFFVRTVEPPALPDRIAWRVELAGLVAEPSTLDLASLERLGHASGRYLIECAGNADPANFGLLSVADWEGVPLTAVLDRMRATSGSHRVLISGVDWENTPQQTSRTSLPGASWIFARADLERAVLALTMNGPPLTADHGSPVRLVVPGWYGCACIKWVDRIELVPDDAPATTQMQEFAARTHQPFDSAAVAASLSAGLSDRPLRARDFLPAVIDTAAMPVRVEKWRVDSRAEYRITGIIWGGSTPTDALSIRFKSGGPWVRVDRCPLPASTLTWSLWTHTWRPEAPGRYEIVLRVDDTSIRTRRLDVFFYVREINIDEI